MSTDLNFEEQKKMVAEIIAKTREKKIPWSVTDQAFSAKAGPLSIYIFRMASAAAWSSLNVALDGVELFTVKNTVLPIQKTNLMTSLPYKAVVEQISELVRGFDNQIKQEKFSKAMGALSSL